MAAPAGNQFWKLRYKHGRDKLFSTPDQLWGACSEYFNWCDSHPWWKNEAVKSGDLAGQIIKVPIARPYTLSGLCIYLDVSTSYWKDLKASENLSEDYSAIIIRVEEIIYTQKFEGAAVGAFNANIIARDLGLREKQDVDVRTPEGITINYIRQQGNEPLADGNS